MEHLFFYSPLKISDVKKIFFDILGAQNVLQGSSTHFIEDVYFSHTIFGVEVRLAYNNYDYDDVYNYFVVLKPAIFYDGYKNDEVVQLLKNILIIVLPNSLQTEVGHEHSNQLVVYSPT